jgi:hypothetical protein
MTRSYVQPALMGGLVAGVLSALPIVSAGNLCCCLWIISGGAVAAYVLQQNEIDPITPVDGAKAGVLAGIVAAFVALIISIPISILIAPTERLVVQRLLERMGNMPPEFREYARGARFGGLRLVLGFLVMLALGLVFSTIGGILGAVVFRKTSRGAETPGP